MQRYQQEVKDNIQELIRLGMMNEANTLIRDYEKIVPGDLEVISMKAVIAIHQNQISMAEEILLQGLAIDQYNFDLLYNLAFVYEQLGQYSQAIIHCKKARKRVLYDNDLKSQVDALKDGICQRNAVSIKNERNNNIIFKNLETIQIVLFVDFDLSMTTNQIAMILNEYGVDVDIAYAGKNPSFLFREDDLPYRKIIRFSDIESLVEYGNCYRYDVIHTFASVNQYEHKIKKIYATSFVNYSFKSDDLNIKKVLDVYSQAKKKSLKISKSSKVVSACNSEKNLTIVIFTYNRPKYLKRILSYFNGFKEKNFDIMILDSSYLESKQENQEIYKKLPDLSIRYLEFENTINAWIKINYGLEQVKTPFVCLCADDDFLTEEGLIKSLEILIRDKTLFSVKGKNLYYVRTMAELKEYDFFEGIYDNDPIARMEKVVRGFVPSLIYQVFRIEDFRKLYCFWVTNKEILPSNPTFQEYLFYFMVLLTGKVGKVNIDLNIRDKGVPSETVMKNFPHALLDRTFNENYQAFKEFIQKYVKLLNGSPEIFLEKSDDMFSSFLINFLQVPKENVYHVNGEFDLKNLEIGMRKSWVWPR